MNKEVAEEKPKLTDRELAKWIKILGDEEILLLYLDGKLTLSSKQVDVVMGIEAPSALATHSMAPCISSCQSRVPDSKRQ